MVKLINNTSPRSTPPPLPRGSRSVAAAGLDLDKLLEVVGAGSGASAMLDLKARPIIERDYEPLFKLGHMLKDVRHCLAEAQRAGRRAARGRAPPRRSTPTPTPPATTTTTSPRSRRASDERRDPRRDGGRRRCRPGVWAEARSAAARTPDDPEVGRAAARARPRRAAGRRGRRAGGGRADRRLGRLARERVPAGRAPVAPPRRASRASWSRRATTGCARRARGASPRSSAARRAPRTGCGGPLGYQRDEFVHRFVRNL